MKAKLDKFERAIEREAEAYRSVSRKERAMIEGTLEKIRKTRNVNNRSWSN